MLKITKNKNCHLCATKLENYSIVKLKNCPPSAQKFLNKKNISKKTITLEVKQCKFCGLVQLTNPPVKYYKEVIRAVGFSKKILKFRENQFKNFVKKYSLRNKKIIEIGSGDGEYLSIMKKYCRESYGLEFSENNIKILKKKKLNYIKGYPDNINTKFHKNKFDGFFCMSFLEHSPNVNLFLKTIYNNLNKNSYGIIEVPNLDMIIKKKLYTEFILDHLNYFTKKTIKQLLNQNGFDVIKCKEIWDNYIISIVVKKRQILKDINMNKIIYNFRDKYKKFKDLNKLKNIAVWGAGHQSLTTLSISNIDKKINYIIDSAIFKQNKYAPGINIKIISPKDIKKKNIDGIIIMAGGYSKEIKKYLIKKKFKVRSIIC